MSHFTVLVIGPDIKGQLQPFHEFECTGVNDEYVVDVDITDEVREQIAKDEDGLMGALDYYGLRDKIVADLTQVDREGEHKYGFAVVRDGELFQAVDRTNPNKKWDWWQIGGRWTGYFKLKPGRKGVSGKPGLMTEHAPTGTADQALKGDIDFEAMRDEACRKAEVKFDKFAPAFAGRELPEWSEVLKRHGVDRIDAAREEFRSNPVVLAIEAIDWATYDGNLRTVFCNGDRAAYVARARREAFQTFAVVKDGKWYERGRMGWWASVSNEKDPAEWSREFANLLDSLPDDTLLTVVDCHI